MSSNRRKSRLLAVQTLYGLEYPTSQSTEQLLAHALEVSCGAKTTNQGQRSEVKEFAMCLVVGVTAHLTEIDEVLSEFTASWQIERLPLTDRNILRVAAFELLHEPEIPVRVSFNEAIELAKALCGPDSPSFINGVLDALSKKHCCEKLKSASNY